MAAKELDGNPNYAERQLTNHFEMMETRRPTATQFEQRLIEATRNSIKQLREAHLLG